jgi:hypothetical protein
MTGSFGSPFSQLEIEMSWTYEAVMATLGDEAQPVPGGILVFRGKHIMVGLCHGGGGFGVTPEGHEILAEYEAPAPVARARKVGSRAKAEPPVDLSTIDVP